MVEPYERFRSGDPNLLCYVPKIFKNPVVVIVVLGVQTQLGGFELGRLDAAILRHTGSRD